MGFDPVESKPDRDVLGFTAVVSLATGLIFGLIPAFRSVSAGYNLSWPCTSLRVPGRIWPLGNVLVAIQIALSLVLVAGAALLARSLDKRMRVDVGFERLKLLRRRRFRPEQA